MSTKIGRNDPCPCGSGKKYKHCCANTDGVVEAERKGHDGAVERALDWLMNKHGKAVSAAIGEMLFDGLQDEERAALEAHDQETWRGIQLNATEWLLAEGRILIRGEPKRVSECLLGPGGPLFTVGQRQWIAQLAERPLRLYDVTDVIPGQQMTLCDALDIGVLPITVREKSGSDASLVGTQLGARIMDFDGHHELSGAVYPFSRLAGPQVIASVREAANYVDPSRDDLASAVSSVIRRQWLAQFYAPMPIPTMMDAYTGEPLLLITDHYRVKDWAALMQSLCAQPDVQGDRAAGWNRLAECQDGQTRPVAIINVHTRADRLSVFYKTQGYADQGRRWFEALAGSAVQFVSRELTDPTAVLTERAAAKEVAARPGAKPRSTAPDLPPEVIAEAIELTIRRSYVKWPDEPIPALDFKTPREAMKTPAGLERVKGLLRSYEASERQSAQQQGRRMISYAFLWEALEIAPA